MYHYTYLIQHKTEDKRYIGVRTSKVHPLLDTEYWGSSRYIPKDVKTTHCKIVLKVHPTRVKALEHEITLHRLNNVTKDNTYYNRASQTSTGFDTSGVPLTPEFKLKLSKALKDRVFSPEHKRNISKALEGKPKSEEHVKNSSIAQKFLASSQHYVNPRQGVQVSEATREKISKAIKEGKTSASTNNNRFSPWFITKDGVTNLFYNDTKEEISVLNGFSVSYYQNLSTKSKGYIPIKRGASKGIIIGNIDDAIKNVGKPALVVRKSAWFITYDTYSVPFYYTTRKEYADRNNISPQSVSDAIYLSRGVKRIQKGPFSGLILGTIA